MNRFWDHVLLPLARAVAPQRICEVGSQHGTLTAKLLDFCAESGAVLHTIDPAPRFDVDAWKERHGERLTFHRALSLNVLGNLPALDLVLIDGDHNWYTVIHELRLLERRARADEHAPPVIVLHDTGWPYGRRDLYYDPETVPPGYRQPFVRDGLHPDSADPVQNGLNAHLDHAIYEHAIRNGVMTAVEDFVEESAASWSFRTLPGLHGLAVLAESSRLESEPLRRAFDSLGEAPLIRAHADAVERQRVLAAIDVQRLKRRCATLEETLAADRSELEAARAALSERADEHERELQALREQLQARTGEVLDAAELVRAAESALEQSRAREREMAETIATLEARAHAAAAANQKIHADSAAEVDRLTGRLAEMHAELRDARAAARASEHDSRAAQARERALADAAEARIERLRGEISARHEALMAAGEPPPGGEDVTRAAFEAQYRDRLARAGLGDLTARELASPWPAFSPLPAAVAPSASIVVCVHDALDDVRRCLTSVATHTTGDYEVIVVNDGSGAETTRFLEQVAGRSDRVRHIHRAAPPHGYTLAANAGLRDARGRYVVLLNSDTVVTRGWLDRLIACFEEDDRLGVVGPLSNAASHQSVPRVRDGGAWATNPLPDWLTVDGMGAAVAALSAQERPRVPFVNGFCYAIHRRVLDRIGLLDEERFASGYCEENDLSVRVLDAGLELAIADDAFVFHAKSRSYTSAGRDRHARPNYLRFEEKHGPERVGALVQRLEESRPTRALGLALEHALAEPRRVVDALHERLGGSLDVVFLLPGVAIGGSGGSHSIVQEVGGMRALGVHATIAVPEGVRDRVEAAYPDCLDLFAFHGSDAELRRVTDGAQVVVGTHFKSIATLGQVVGTRGDALAAYYVQDYEPFFSVPGSAHAVDAAESYTRVPGCLLFAKTHWLCNVVSALHGVSVSKVEPSVDRSIYRPLAARPDRDEIVVAAMLRPRTPRRRAQATVRLLERLLAGHPKQLRVVTFGCQPAEAKRLTDSAAILEAHRGILARADVAELLRHADVFLDLSSYQAFGRTALEAMACGCVPVVPETGGAWEYAEPGVNAIVAPVRDEQAAVVTALAEPARVLAMREAALRTAARYSVERAALSEISLFAAELLSRRSVPAGRP